jgi:hypothetical protein
MLAPNTTPTPTASTTEEELTRLADRIRDEHKAMRTAMCHAVAHAIRAGEALIQAKAAVPSGSWHRWLKEHCELSKRTALRYIQLAQHREEIEHKIAGEQHLSVANLGSNNLDLHDIHIVIAKARTRARHRGV